MIGSQLWLTSDFEQEITKRNEDRDWDFIGLLYPEGFINFLVIVDLRHTVPSVNKYIFPNDIIIIFVFSPFSFFRETILLVAYS